VNRPKPPIWCPGIRAGHPLTRGLLAYWPFWEAAGERLGDLSRKGHHGTLTDMDPATDWVASPVGAALDFDDVDDHVVCPQVIPSGATAFTIAAFLKPVSAGFALSQWHAPGGVKHGVIIRDSAGDLHVWRDFAAEIAVVDFWTARYGQWLSVAATFSTTDAWKWYTDGELLYTDSSKTPPAFDSGCGFGIGANYEGGSDWGGQMAMAAVWDRVLTAGEIARLAQDPWCMSRPIRRGYLWAAASAALDGYYIYRGVGRPENIDWDNAVGDVTGATATLTGLGHAASTKYCYGIRPYRDIGGGEKLVTPTFAGIAEVEIDSGGDWVGTRPWPVRNFHAEIRSGGRIRLRWRYVPGPAIPSQFNIWYGGSRDLGGGEPDETVAYRGRAPYSKELSLSDGTRYWFRIQVATSGGAMSVPVTIGPLVADATGPAAPAASIGSSF